MLLIPELNLFKTAVRRRVADADDEHAKDGRQLRALDCRNYPLWSSYPRSAYKLTESEFVGTAEVAGKCG